MHKISNDYPETLHAEWVMSNVCNFKCSYCAPILFDGSSGFPDVNDAIEFWNFVHTDINSNNKMLTLSGGEPTLWPKLAEFFNGLDKSWYTAIVTNASRTLRWWNKFLEDCTNLHRVTISIHLEFADVDHIIEVCKLLHNRCQTTVLVLFDNSKIEYARQVAEKVKSFDLNISLKIKPITENWGTGKSIEYNKEDLDFIKTFRYEHMSKDLANIPVAAHLYVDEEYKSINYAHEMIAKNINSFRGWKCEAGSKRLVVWHDGNVYGAQCHTAKQIPLGNIKDKKIKQMTSIICQNDFCNCIPDLRIPKWKEVDV